MVLDAKCDGVFFIIGAFKSGYMETENIPNASFTIGFIKISKTPLSIFAFIRK